ncbi:hypothetical protein UPYG_G00047450 [Umbra pygmaea]|uniref:Protein MGARP N-terminal domain-containing protein n=1 Tax=Umbra pygmaea TaxID=75934 RepID=A0ABD0XR97_UMBPY
MLFCRAAWQRLGPLARKTVFLPIFRNAGQRRHMSFGIPGGSATNMAYVVLCGGGLTAAVVYAYKTVNGDSERYNDRLAEISSRPKEAALVQEEEPADEAIEDPAEPVPIEAEVAVQIVAETAAVDEPPTPEVTAEPLVEAVAPSEVEEAPAEDVVTDVFTEEVAAEVVSEAVAVEEAHSAEAHGSVSDILAASMNLLVGPEIAAASVAERRLVSAVQCLEDKNMDSLSGSVDHLPLLEVAEDGKAIFVETKEAQLEEITELEKLLLAAVEDFASEDVVEQATPASKQEEAATNGFLQVPEKVSEVLLEEVQVIEEASPGETEVPASNEASDEQGSTVDEVHVVDDKTPVPKEALLVDNVLVEPITREADRGAEALVVEAATLAATSALKIVAVAAETVTEEVIKEELCHKCLRETPASSPVDVVEASSSPLQVAEATCPDHELDAVDSPVMREQESGMCLPGTASLTATSTTGGST